MNCPHCGSEDFKFVESAEEYVCQQVGCMRIFSVADIVRRRQEIRALSLELPFELATAE